MPDLRMTYNRENDVAHIYLVPWADPFEVGWTHICGEPGHAANDIILDFGADGKVERIEVVNASQMLPQRVLDEAETIIG